MIQEFKVKNFCSFKDEVILNFEASRETFAQESQVVEINNVRLLRYGIIYGFNASGKSNILKAFDFLKYFWDHIPQDYDSPTGVIPFRLDDTSEMEPTAFEITFYVGDTKYVYELVLDIREVYLEKLSFYNSTQPIMLFERTLDQGESVISFNSTNPHSDKVNTSIKEAINAKCLRNMSFFAARNQVNTRMPLIDAAKDWLRKGIMPTIYPSTSLMSYAGKMTRGDRDSVEYILEFLKTADFNVTGLSSSVIDRDITDDTLRLLLGNEEIPSFEKERLKREKSIKLLRTVFEHTVETSSGEETYSFQGKDESSGTLRVFGLEAALYRVMKEGGFLPIDEIEASLHPLLLEKVLYEYLKMPVRSQILIATHEDGLLDLTDDLIRKDAVWFTEKGKDGVSELYKLTDFRGLNRLSSIREAYRNKRFGATMKS